LNPSSEHRFFVKLLDNRSHFLFQGLYYGASICLVSFASAMAVVTLNIHYRGLRGGSVPPWIRTIALGYLAKIVFLDFETEEVEKRNSLALESPKKIPSFVSKSGLSNQ